MAMTCFYSGAKECDGCMRCQPDPDPVYCGICGKEVETIYRDKDGYTVGCNHCIQIVDPYDE